MKAVVISAPEEVNVETVPDPTPGQGEVVVEVAGCGICGTDLHILEGEFAPSLPIVPGHEFAGEIVAVGPKVSGWSVGDQVAVDPSLHCGECYYCRRARGNLCENWAAIGVSTAGGAADYALAPAKNLYRLTEDVTTADAALIEPLSCAVRGFDVLPRDVAAHYLIYGAGTMGLMMMELAKRVGAASVSVTDINEKRLDTARLLGCDAAVPNADQLASEYPRGWDVVIDCTGVVAAIEDGLSRVGRGGTFLQFGVANEAAQAAISPFKIYNQEITITGSMAVLHSFERAGDLFRHGVLRPDVMISDRLPLSEYATAIGRFKSGVGRKIQVVPDAAAAGAR